MLDEEETCSEDEEVVEAVGLTDSDSGPEPVEATETAEVVTVDSCGTELELDELESVVEEAVLVGTVNWLDEVVESELNVDELNVDEGEDVDTIPSAICGVLLLVLDKVVVVRSDVLSADEVSVAEVLCVRRVVAGVLELVKT